MTLGETRRILDFSPEFLRQIVMYLILDFQRLSARKKEIRKMFVWRVR